jgi:hypothetical protein
MVTMVSDARYFGSDNFWDREIDYHVYEKLERVKGRQPVQFGLGFENTAASMRAFEMRIAKAKALDRARKKLIQDVREKARNTFPDLLSAGFMSGTHVKRTVGGVEGVPDSAIML